METNRWANWGQVLEHRWRAILLLLVSLTLATRLVYGLVIVPTLLGQDIGQPGQCDGYHVVAQNVLAGYGYVYSPGGPYWLWRGPGYVGYLIVVWSLLGTSLVAVILAHALTEAVSTVVLVLLARRVTSRPAIGALAGLAFALYPESVRQAGVITTEPLFTLLLLGLTWCLLRLFERHSWRWAAATGVLVALLSLTRPVFQFFPFLLLGAVVLWNRGNLRLAMRAQIVVWLTMVLVVAPWTIHNYYVSGEFIAISTQGPTELYVGTQLQYDLDYGESREATGAGIRQLRREFRNQSSGDPIASERPFLTLALDKIKAAPLGYLKSTILRVVGFWYLGYTLLGTIKNLAEHLPIYALAVVGLLTLQHNGWRKFILLLPILYLNLVHGLTHAMLRYALPVMPIVFLFAASGTLWLLARINVGRVKPEREAQCVGMVEH